MKPIIARTGAVLYWWGLALLATALMIAITDPHPRDLNSSVLYWTLLTCGLIPFGIGGVIHFMLDVPPLTPRGPLS